MLPRGYDATSASTSDARHYPLMLYLHGRGGKENNTYDDRKFFDSYGTVHTSPFRVLEQSTTGFV